MKNNKVLVKYYAKVVDVLEKPKNQMGRIKKYHIWASEHVRSYIPQKAHIWILRVYKLRKPVYTGRTKGMVYANTLTPIDVSGAKAVINAV